MLRIALRDKIYQNCDTDAAVVYTLYFMEPEKSVLQGKTAAVLLYYQMRIIEKIYIRINNEEMMRT